MDRSKRERSPRLTTRLGRFNELLAYAEIGSTNSELISRARDGAVDGLVVTADHQTGGRGRLGRTWSDVPGKALLVSALVRPEAWSIGSTELPLIPLAAGLGVAQAIHDVCGVVVDLDWPNDVLVDERKLGGILCESTGSGGRVDAVVIGIGLNLGRVSIPDELRREAVSLDELCGPVGRDELLDAVLDRVQAECESLAADAASVVGAYRGRCVTVGREVAVATCRETISGRAADISASGSLVVVLSDGSSRSISFGELE